MPTSKAPEAPTTPEKRYEAKFSLDGFAVRPVPGGLVLTRHNNTLVQIHGSTAHILLNAVRVAHRSVPEDVASEKAAPKTNKATTNK